METLHRLRIVWLILCALAAGVVALAWSGGTPDNIIWTLFIGLALLAGAAGASTWFGVMSCLWVGGAFIAAGAMLDKGTPGDVGSVITIGGGGYILFAVVTWIIRPKLKGGARP